MKRAFTLIELLVVIAIIAILAAILFPVFAQAKKAAKYTVALSGLKQLGTAQLIYSSDADDLFSLCYTADLKGNYTTWQGLILPYTKNWQIVLDPLRTTPLNNSDPQVLAFLRSQQFGMPLRAIANSAVVAANQATFTPASSGYWPYPSGSTIHVDGIAGAGIEPNSPNAFSNVTAPSYSQTSLANVADMIMIAQAANWDMWWGEGGATSPLRFCAYWTPDNPYSSYGANFGYGGPNARKNPVTNSTTAGDGTGIGTSTACAQPNGQSIYVAADGHAAAKDWRGQLTKGTLITGTTYSMTSLNATGN